MTTTKTTSIFADARLYLNAIRKAQGNLVEDVINGIDDNRWPSAKTDLQTIGAALDALDLTIRKVIDWGSYWAKHVRIDTEAGIIRARGLGLGESYEEADRRRIAKIDADLAATADYDEGTTRARLKQGQLDAEIMFYGDKGQREDALCNDEEDQAGYAMQDELRELDDLRFHLAEAMYYNNKARLAERENFVYSDKDKREDALCDEDNATDDEVSP